MVWLRNNWRAILAHLPLPMLGLAASYGVYSFALLFVPDFFALAQAAAFELTYIGLAVIEVTAQDRRERATRISIAAVAVSVVYNSASGYFHRNPLALSGLSFPEELGLAIVHGAPLALTAYFVADFLLHPNARKVTAPDSSMPATETAPLSRRKQVTALADQLGKSESTIWRQVRAGKISLGENDTP